MTRFIGLTGRNASGKGAAADYLKAQGFQYLSLSDLLREELRARGVEPTRENLTRNGQELRAAEGPAVLAARALKRLEGAEGDWVIDSVRAPAEIEALRKLPGFRLIAIDAPAELRFARLRARGRAGDSATLEEFLAHEAAEDTTDPNAQQLGAAFKMADLRVMNDGPVEALHEALAGILEQSPDDEAFVYNFEFSYERLIPSTEFVGGVLAVSAASLPLVPGLATGAVCALLLCWMALRLGNRVVGGPVDRAVLIFLIALWWATAFRADLHYFLGALFGGDPLAAADPRYGSGRHALWAWADYWHLALVPAGALFAYLSAPARRRALAAFAAASAVSIGAGLLEFASRWNLRWDGLGPAIYGLLGDQAAHLLIGRRTLDRIGGEGRIYGFFDHPLTFGGYLCVALFLFAALALFAGRARRHAALAGVAGLLTMVAGNRAYWVGLPAGLAALLIGRDRKFLARAGLVGVAAVGAALCFPSVRQRAFGMTTAGMMGGRVCFWRAGGEMALARPLTGWGPQGWRIQGRPYLAHACPAESNLTHVHNGPLQLLVEGGVPLLLAGLWLLWSLARALRARSHLAGTAGALARGALAALLAFSAASLFEWNFMDKEAAMPLLFWIGAALHWPADAGDAAAEEFGASGK